MVGFLRIQRYVIADENDLELGIKGIDKLSFMILKSLSQKKKIFNKIIP